MSSVKKGMADSSPLRGENHNRPAPTSKSSQANFGLDSSFTGPARGPSSRPTAGGMDTPASNLDDFFGGPPKATQQPATFSDDIFGMPPPYSASTSSSTPFGDGDVFGASQSRSSVGSGGGSGSATRGGGGYVASAAAFDDLLGPGTFDVKAKEVKRKSKAAIPDKNDDLLGGFRHEQALPAVLLAPFSVSNFDLLHSGSQLRRSPNVCGFHTSSL